MIHGTRSMLCSFWKQNQMSNVTFFLGNGYILLNGRHDCNNCIILLNSLIQAFPTRPPKVPFMAGLLKHTLQCLLWTCLFLSYDVMALTTHTFHQGNNATVRFQHTLVNVNSTYTTEMFTLDNAFPFFINDKVIESNWTQANMIVLMLKYSKKMSILSFIWKSMISKKQTLMFT